MSHYEKLRQPLFCSWLVAQGGESVCGQCFWNVRVFVEHMRRCHAHHCQLPSTAEDGCAKTGVACSWRGCDQVVLCTSIRDYLIHILGHPYYCFLKLLGKEFQVIKTWLILFAIATIEMFCCQNCTILMCIPVLVCIFFIYVPLINVSWSIVVYLEFWVCSSFDCHGYRKFKSTLS